MKYFKFVFVAILFAMASCTTEKESFVETDFVSSSSLSENDGYAELDAIIFAYVGFQDSLALLDEVYLEEQLALANNAIAIEDYQTLNSVIYNGLGIDNNYLILMENEINLINSLFGSGFDWDTEIQKRMAFLVCDNQLSSYTGFDECDEITTRWWGGRCGLKRHLLAVGAGVGALAGVAAIIGTGGAAAGLGAVAVIVGVTNVVDLVNDCS